MCSVCDCLCEHLSWSLLSLCMTFTHEGGWVFVWSSFPSPLGLEQVMLQLKQTFRDAQWQEKDK